MGTKMPRGLQAAIASLAIAALAVLASEQDVETLPWGVPRAIG